MLAIPPDDDAEALSRIADTKNDKAGPTSSLKTAIDVVYKEWGHKAAGFVGYGVDGAVRAIEQLRQVMGNIRIADVSVSLAFSLHTDFADFTTFQPADRHAAMLKLLLADLIPWSNAQAVRTAA